MLRVIRLVNLRYFQILTYYKGVYTNMQLNIAQLLIRVVHSAQQNNCRYFNLIIFLKKLNYFKSSLDRYMHEGQDQ